MNHSAVCIKCVKKYYYKEEKMSYNLDFYNDLRRNSKNTDYTAKKVYRYLAQFFMIDSVCDVGCGVGSWLAAFQQGGGIKQF